jgi:hypothetical protein
MISIKKTYVLTFLLCCVSNNIKEGSCFTIPTRKAECRSMNNKEGYDCHHHHHHQFVFPNHENAQSQSKSFTILNLNKDNIDTTSNDADPTGMKRGLVLFPLVLLVAVWLFSIPPEFRRARICTEQQVIDNPNSKCITAQNWVSGVKGYYQNGGGVEFDFTVDPEG